MFQSYRTLFQSLCISSFIHGLTGTPDHDGNRTNIDELIGMIGGDKRLDGKDHLYINELLDKLASSTEISDATRQQISIEVKGELEKSLIQGYTVLDETSYNTYVRVMNFLHPEIKSPAFHTIESTVFNTWFFKTNFSFLYNSQTQEITVHYYNAKDQDAWFTGTEVWVISKWVFIPWNNFLNWDKFSNNNQFGLSADMVDGVIPKAEEKEEEEAEEQVVILPPEKKQKDDEADILPEEGKLKSEEKEEVIVLIPESESQPIPKPDEYTVQSGDTLWDIVKEHYRLTDDQVIAKRVNEVVESQTDANLLAQLRKDVYGANMRNVKDGVRGDILYPWDIIILPVFESTSLNQDDGDK